MTTGTRTAGEFCWINMLTPQPADARAFFADVLGWAYAELPGVGHLVLVGGHRIGGLFDLHGPQTPPGTYAHIGVMVKVANADATAERVRALGGTARAPFDIANQGRMTVCHDPNGAEFDVWEPRANLGTDVDTAAHGAPSWFETITTDVDRATAFYSALFGWTPKTMPMPGGDGWYTTFTLDGVGAAGMLRLTPAMGAVRSHWGVYFSVDDLDRAVGRAVSHGARVEVGPRDIPDVGRFCGIVSPQGVWFYPIQYRR